MNDVRDDLMPLSLLYLTLNWRDPVSGVVHTIPIEPELSWRHRMWHIGLADALRPAIIRTLEEITR